MKERLEKLLETLNKRRDEMVHEHLNDLENESWNDSDSMRAVHSGSRLRDIDHHITTVMLELKRLEVTHAS